MFDTTNTRTNFQNLQKINLSLLRGNYFLNLLRIFYNSDFFKIESCVILKRYGTINLMEIAKRLALVLHWMGFVGGVFFGGIALFVFFAQGEVSALLSFPVIFLFFTAIGWLIRYIIVGKVHFLPWK